MPDPTKKRLLTPDEIRRCEIYYAYGMTQKEMAALIGVSIATFERRIKDQPELLEGLLKGKAKADTQVIDSLFKNAVKKGNVTAQIFWLKTRRGWSEHNTDDDSTKEIRVVFDRDKKPEAK